MAKKLYINGCIGCSICTTICSELFELDENHCSHNLYGDEAEIPDDLLSYAIQAMDACPVCAIEIKDNEI